MSTDRIKVLRVIARLNVGGPALHVAYLSEGLGARGYETILVSGTLARGEESMEHVARGRNVEIVTLEGLSREIAPVADLRAVLRLARIIRRERPDILHTHTAKAGAVGRVAALLSGRARPPVTVHTFHGHVLKGYFGPLRTLLFRVLERWLALSTTALVAVSSEVRDDLVRLGVAPPERFAVVRLGVELAERVHDPASSGDDVRRVLGIPRDAFVVGWVGRMTSVKRIDDLFAALRGLLDRGVDAILLLVGDGPDRHGAEQRAHELGVAKRCRFVGYQVDVARFYGAMDVLLLPSANEGTPVSVIEALAAKVPAVATRVGGVPDVIDDEVDGYLVEVGDVDRMADRLERLAREPASRTEMGARGRDRMLERYAVERLLDDIDRLYRSLLAEARSARSDRDET